MPHAITVSARHRVDRMLLRIRLLTRLPGEAAGLKRLVDQAAVADLIAIQIGMLPVPRRNNSIRR
jgi:hypothetical protein